MIVAGFTGFEATVSGQIIVFFSRMFVEPSFALLRFGISQWLEGIVLHFPFDKRHLAKVLGTFVWLTEFR